VLFYVYVSAMYCLLSCCPIIIVAVEGGNRALCVLTIVGKRTYDKSVERRFLGKRWCAGTHAYLTFHRNPRAKPCNVTSDAA
jgi:hypothetical protein